MQAGSSDEGVQGQPTIKDNKVIFDLEKGEGLLTLHGGSASVECLAAQYPFLGAIRGC